MTYSDILENHHSLNQRKEKSSNMLTRIREAFSKTEFFKSKPISIFAAGSLGRRDIGGNSDLDLFAVAESAKRSNLENLEVLAGLIEINRTLGFPPFSNDGEYLKVYSIEKMCTTLGGQKDDSENLFTARMLMLLESVPIYGAEYYANHINRITKHYFRDSPGHKPFKPLFLVNDILRYWRTLCLNYESIRNNTDRPWRKRNVNLKFSRKLTVFGSILPIVSIPVESPTQFVDLVSKTPMERFALGLDALHDDGLKTDFKQFLGDYETFLKWKEDEDIDRKMHEPVTKKEAYIISDRFSLFIYKAAMNEHIPEDFRRFLVI